jgi:putative flippase GtrA
MLRQLLQRQTHRYLFIGGSVYVLEVIIIIVAQSLGVSAIIAVGISFWVGIVASFLLQKFITFDDKRTNSKIVVPQIVAFALLVTFNFGFTLLVTDALEATLPATITRTLALGVTTFWNFYLYKTRIFRTDQSPLY